MRNTPGSWHCLAVNVGRSYNLSARSASNGERVYCPVMVTTVRRIFRPGAGATPPALAGREAEQRVLSRCLADLSGGSAPPHDVVLVGPRGNGKTALLNWFRGACGEASVDVVALTPQHIPNRAVLADALAPRRGMAKWLPRKVGVAGVASAEWQSATATKNLVQALLARLAAALSVAPRVADYYQSRYRELRAESLLAAATAVAELLRTRNDVTATERELDTALAAAGVGGRGRSGRGARRAEPPGLRLVSARAAAAGCLERRHPLADDVHSGKHWLLSLPDRKPFERRKCYCGVEPRQVSQTPP